MSWWTGKDKLVVISFGDSNGGALATATNTAPGLIPYNSANQFWVRDGSVPYIAGTQSWQPLDHDAASRLDERLDANGDNSAQGLLYVGQVCGGHGCPAMSLAHTLYEGTELPIYTYGAYMGGSVSADWSDYLWSQLLASVTAALVEIPGSPTAADVIHISTGGGDLVVGTDWWRAFLLLTGGSDWHQPFTSPTAQEFYTNVRAFRTLLVDAGFWVPGVTQVIFGDIPRNGYDPVAAYPEWQGLEYVRTRLNDRVTQLSSVGRSYDPPFPIHFSPQSYVDMGREAGERVLAQIPKQRSTVSVGGVRLSVNGSKLRVHSP